MVGSLYKKYPHARVRNITSLGDRVLGSSVSKNFIRHDVGRYLQIMYDAPPYGFEVMD